VTTVVVLVVGLQHRDLVAEEPGRSCPAEFTCVAPSDLAGRTRIVWSCRHVPPLSGLLPTLPGVPRIGLPPASPGRCDGLPVESFHLHMVKWRLVAHVVLEVLV
jgi:hypothetical protein